MMNIELYKCGGEKFDAVDSEVNLIFNELKSQINNLYGKAHYSITDKLRVIYYCVDPKDKTVLDLGCGSINTTDGNVSWKRPNSLAERLFEPWLARYLHEYGCNIVGVDVQENDSELFENYSLDLLMPDSLAQFENNSFDMIYAFNLFDSPYLLGGMGKILFNNLFPQVKRILKDDGYYVFEKLLSGYNPMIHN